MNDTNRRAYLRYTDSDSVTVRFLIDDEEGWKPVIGLLVNESHGGFACVYVGPARKVNSEIVWQETENVATTCRVTRCQKLHEGVFLLALEIAS